MSPDAVRTFFLTDAFTGMVANSMDMSRHAGLVAGPAIRFGRAPDGLRQGVIPQNVSQRKMIHRDLWFFTARTEGAAFICGQPLSRSGSGDAMLRLG